MTRPPSVAAALLIHLTQNVGLAGDLTEEFSAGQSRFWYWRQVVGAIVSQSWSDVRDHKLATLRAIVLGFSFVAFMGRYVMWQLLYSQSLATGVPALIAGLWVKASGGKPVVA